MAMTAAIQDPRPCPLEQYSGAGSRMRGEQSAFSPCASFAPAAAGDNALVRLIAEMGGKDINEGSVAWDEMVFFALMRCR